MEAVLARRRRHICHRPAYVDTHIYVIHVYMHISVLGRRRRHIRHRRMMCIYSHVHVHDTHTPTAQGRWHTRQQGSCGAGRAGRARTWT